MHISSNTSRARENQWGTVQRRSKKLNLEAGTGRETIQLCKEHTQQSVTKTRKNLPALWTMGAQNEIQVLKMKLDEQDPAVVVTRSSA
jgi:hypothetical protein